MVCMVLQPRHHRLDCLAPCCLHPSWARLTDLATAFRKASSSN
jgi:hypothetical protein